MAKLRHIALSVTDLEKSAQFYEKTFELKRVGTTDSELAKGIYLSDGTVSLALLIYKTDAAAGKLGKDFVGVNHIGFWVDDLDKADESIQANGGEFFLDLPDAKDTLYYEKKYHDPDGIVFDISHHGWAGATK